MSKRRTGPFCVLAVLFMLTLLFPMAVCADQNTPQKVVKVGITEYPQYAFYDVNGKCAGADVEYLYKLAEYANIHVEVTLIPDDGSDFSQLDSGRIDMLFDVIKEPAQAQNHLYSDYELENTAQSVYVRKEDDRYQFGNVEQLKTMTLGGTEGNYVNELFKIWCANYGFTPKMQIYGSRDELNAALAAGQIDGAVYDINHSPGYRTILNFSPKPYYVAFRSDSLELKQQMDAAMARIAAEQPMYREKLLENYVASDTQEMDAYSAEEQAYLAAHPVVTLAVLKNDEPYYSLGNDGKPKGILPDFYAQVTSLTGLQFTFRAYPGQQEAIQAVKNGEADCIGMYSNGLIAAQSEGLRLTNNYDTFSAVMITRLGTDPQDIRRIAVKRRSLDVVQRGLKMEGDTKLITYDTAGSCFSALNHGDVDAMITGWPSATWLVNQTNAAGYTLSPQSTMDMNLCGALNADNAILWSILNKAIRVSRYRFSSIETQDTMAENNWRTLLARVPPAWMAALLLLFVASMAAMAYALFSARKRQHEMADLVEARLRNERQQARLEALDRSNREKNQFFSNISHDMRTPLNAIIGFSDLAAREQIPPHTREYLEKIQISGKLLLGLINDTLTLSKANSGKLRLHLEQVDTRELFASITVPIREAAEKKQITFVADTTGVRMRVIEVDRLNLQKIALNLLTNAVKYTPPGGRVEMLAYDQEPDAQGYNAVLIVRDNGIGMDESFLPHMYEPFVQENDNGGRSSGSGLGLAIVQQLVTLMGGAITVRSEKGKGTTFTVKFRFESTAEEPLCGAVPGSPELPEGQDALLAGRKVLLCEDNAMNAEIASALLAAWGVAVTEVTDGRQGVEKFKESEEYAYALILMDIRMPVMNGLDAARAIRSLPRPDAGTIPIVATTADAFPEDIQSCRAAGMQDHIAKPLDPGKMAATLRKWIAWGDAQKAAPAEPGLSGTPEP